MKSTGFAVCLLISISSKHQDGESNRGDGDEQTLVINSSDAKTKLPLNAPLGPPQSAHSLSPAGAQKSGPRLVFLVMLAWVASPSWRFPPIF